MQASISYSGNFCFKTTIRDHTFLMDVQAAAGGENKGPTPKELLIAGVIGCTGMDVAALLKKHKMVATRLDVSASGDVRKEHPRVLSSLAIIFEVEGAQVGESQLIEAVTLSLTKFCGVTAMISKVVPVSYMVRLNGKQIAQGQADFNL